MGWDISLGVEVLFLQFSTLSRLTWGFVSLAHAYFLFDEKSLFSLLIQPWNWKNDNFGQKHGRYGKIEIERKVQIQCKQSRVFQSLGLVVSLA